MAGDTVTIATQAWYQEAVQPPPSSATNLLNDLLNALTGGIITNSHGLYNTTDNDPNTILSGDLGQFFTNDENTNYTTSAPKAFLNYVAFDNQLNMVSGNSGVVQVPQISAGEIAQPLVAPQLIIQKDGYIYIYVSNESAMKVYFDNLVIHHNRGPILQTDSYYPYGLTMAGISDQAALSLENKLLYNGKELQDKEFSDNSGLDWYDYGARMYDDQIGRWGVMDPMSEKYDGNSPYGYVANNPVSLVDPSGMDIQVTGAGAYLSGQDAQDFIRDLQDMTNGGQDGFSISVGGGGNDNNNNSNNFIDVTTGILQLIFPGANQNYISNLAHDLNHYMEEFGINNVDALAQYLAQAGVETHGFTALSENLDYKSVSRLEQVFPRLFVKGPYNAQDYVDNPTGLAMIAYGGYQGRGDLDLTGVRNYKAFTAFYDANFSSSINFVANPNLISNDPYATISGLWFFQQRVLDDPSINIANVAQVTAAITGNSIPQLNGLAQRGNYFDNASSILSMAEFFQDVGIVGF